MQQLSIFNSLANDTVNDPAVISKIGGLSYIPGYISSTEHEHLWQSVNAEEWLGDLKRRVQHYGYKYDYRARYIDYSMRIGELPDWSLSIAQKLYDDGYMPELPDQLIVNEYEPGQGIASHIDCQPCFKDTVISLSLGSACTMNFVNVNTREKVELYLEPKSLVVLTDDARYKWTHGITGKKSDVFKGVKTYRDTRISLTFRNIILNHDE